MKYVILDAKGHKLPVIFPEALNHDIVATAFMEAVIRQVPTYKDSVAVFGAGFIDPLCIAVYGHSDTLGVESKPTDLPYLAFGASIAHMPPDMALATFTAITEKKFMIPERMKYGHDQREWVRAADEQLPALRQHAIELQEVARRWYQVSTTTPFPGVFGFRHEASNEAIYALNKVLYYEAMRRINLPETER